MPRSRRRPDPQLIERLAAEFVLGTLRGGARLRFGRWIATDATVAGAVRRWEDRLAPLAARVPRIAPSPHVWQAIERRTGSVSAPLAPRPSALPRARARGLAIAASVIVL